MFQVLKIVAAEIDDVRMSYPLQSTCKSELHELCSSVDPSKAQVREIISPTVTYTPALRGQRVA